MTVKEIKDMIMHQFMQMEPEDVQAYLPYMITYVNEGYDKLVFAWAKTHTGTEYFPLLTNDSQIPQIPERYHKALMDWATWCMYRNGNQQKQQRGYEYRRAFEEALLEIANSGGEDVLGDADGDGLIDRTGEPVSDIRHFHSIPW